MVRSLNHLIAAVFFLSSSAHASLFDSVATLKPVVSSRQCISRVLEYINVKRDKTWITRMVPERAPNFLDDLEWLEEYQYGRIRLGASVDTRFIKDLDTRIYYTATAKPLADGSIPIVDPTKRALVLYFHGSGTQKASGATFAGKMNKLAAMDYSVVSFDLPFHKAGSRNPALTEAPDFAAYVNNMVKTLQSPGQPVYMVGHSFGPDVIAEFVTRYPHSVDGAILLSPGGFDDVTSKWYQERTLKMGIFAVIEQDHFGGQWAGLVTRKNKWNQLKAAGRVDPTVANPKLKLRVVSGELEEYVPGPLDVHGNPTKEPRTYDVCAAFRKFFKNIDCRIEPGIGHLIFDHKDANGHDVVLREILGINGDSLADEKALKAASNAALKTPAENLAAKYSKDPLFRSWLDMTNGGNPGDALTLIREMIAQPDAKRIGKIAQDFSTLERQRLAALNMNIQSTAEWAPEFFAANAEQIAKLSDAGNDPVGLYMKYLEFLRTATPETRASHAVTGPEVYLLPEKVKLTAAEIELRKSRMQRGRPPSTQNEPIKN